MFMFLMAVPPAQSGGRDDIIEMCILKIAGGDREALVQLYEQTQAAVYGFALSILKNRQDAEDVLQDAYIKIWQAAGSYAPQGKPLAWIFTITRNLARMRLREQARIVVAAPEEWQELFAEEPRMDYEDRLVLASVMGVLADEERQIVMLHAVAGMKHREIAQILHLGLSTVLSKYNRALKKLRNALKEAD